MHIHSLLPNFIISLSLATLAKAGRFGGLGKAISIPIVINISSVNTATLSFYIIFCIFAGLQLIVVTGLFKRRAPEGGFPRRRTYTWCLLLALAFLTTEYGLGAAATAANRKSSRTRVLAPAISFMQDLTFRLTDLAFYTGLMVVLRHRQRTFLLDKDPGTQPSLLCKIWMYGLLVVMGGVAIANLALQAAATNPQNRQTLNSLSDAYTALWHISFVFYILATITILVSCRILRQEIKKAPGLAQGPFEKNVLDRIHKEISPWLITRALYMVIAHIVVATADADRSIKLNGAVFNFMAVIVEGFTYLFAFSSALFLGEIEKPKEGKEQEKVEVEVQDGAPRG